MDTALDLAQRGLTRSLAVRGILALCFGVAALVWPGLSLVALVALFGFYALGDGIASFVIAARHSQHRWWHVVEGILGVVVGAFTFARPANTLFALFVFIAALALVRGVVEIIQAFRLRKYAETPWLLGLAGILSVVFGVFLLARPAAGLLAIALIIGIYAIAFGILFLVMAVRAGSVAPPHIEGGRGPQVPQPV